MKKNWQIFWHIVFWVGIVTYFALVVHNNSKMTTEELLVIFGLYAFINIGLFYVNFLYLIPKFLDKKSTNFTLLPCLLLLWFLVWASMELL